MKRQTYLRDESLLTLLSLHDFIIPEIQREYVWGSASNTERVLKPFLESIKNSACVDSCHYAHGLDNVHIGFLYSYKPQYIRDISERITDEYLIDGQQRFTSLFLLLLVRAIRENRLVDFNNLIRWEDGNMAFDYKVRQLTHLFIKDLMSKIQNDGEQVFDDIVNGDYPCWLMNDYLCDTTVTNIISAIKCIHVVFPNNEDLYYDYLLTRIHFWHFKTDVTSQGEELYITMNSRGEELASNEVQKARELHNTNQAQWGPQWENFQTYFWRNRKQGKADNFDADKGFNNLLSCIEAMGYSFGDSYNDIQDTKKAVDALRYIVDTDWESILKGKDESYYTAWIASFKNDVWARINTTTAKWSIEKDSDTVQRENAVLLWPLLYYYFKQTTNGINEMVFIRLMHLCYLNYHSKKTNHAYIKEFIDELCSSGNNMLSLSSIPKKCSFLSDENIYLSDIIGKNSYPNQLESTIWMVQDCPYFLDGEDVGGDTIIVFVKSMEYNRVDVCSRLQILYDNYQLFFPENNPEKNEVLLKRILLHYKGRNNDLFWKRTSPYYDRNYETSSWKRILRHEAFLFFYEEISNTFNDVVSQKDLESFVEKKQDDFFRDSNNRVFTAQKWSDRRLAILFDTMTCGDLWNTNRYKDLGFCEDVNVLGKPFIANTWIGNRICGRRNQWQGISLPTNWEWKLQRKYPYFSFSF